MSNNQIFSKTISIIKHHQSEYKPSEKSGSKPKNESDDENEKMYSTKIANKNIKKIIVLPNRTGANGNSNSQQIAKKTGVLNIQTKQQKDEARMSSSYPIFIRNVKEQTSANELRTITGENESILGVSINNRQATITFSTRVAAENAIQKINNYKENGFQMTAVQNFKSEKVIQIGNYKGKQGEDKLRMDKKESIFDRVQMK